MAVEIQLGLDTFGGVTVGSNVTLRHIDHVGNTGPARNGAAGHSSGGSSLLR